MSDRFTWHGGGLKAAQAQYGGSDWIDLSTGINPHGWPIPRDMAIDWSRLPGEAELQALEAAAAAHFGADPACVCALPGTEIGLRMMGDLLPGPARWLRPSYRTHGEMLPQATPVERPEEAGDATLILANPNNPDGRLLDQNRLRGLMENRWLLIDEAFADADPAMSMAGDVAEGRKLLVFRSFGKFFGLAGVRLGFLIGPPSFLTQVRHRLGAWPVSAPAIAIGTAAYRDRAWINTLRDQLKHEAAALDALLARSGHRAIGSSPLFRLIEVADAAALFAHLARRAILTRPFADHPRWLRIGLPADADAAARLDAALRDG
jgi:cobalamin biosynthetic protein CobC